MNVRTTGSFLPGYGLLVAAMIHLLAANPAIAEVYEYDPAGRLTRVIYDDGASTRYTWDASGNLLQAVHGGPGLADLSLTGTVSPDPVTFDTTPLTYTLTVENLGPDTASSVTIGSALPPGADFISAIPSTGSCNDGSPVSCDLGDLSVGTSVTVTILAGATAPGTLDLTASTDSQTSDLVTGNNVTNSAVQLVYADSDKDGLFDFVEQGGPNGGDGNNDGIADSLQPFVGSLPALQGGDITIEATGNCDGLTALSSSRESDLADLDPEYIYPLGVTSFNLACKDPGGSAEVTVYYHGESTLTGYRYRYYGPATAGQANSWFDLPGVTYATEIIDGNTVATATFTLVDGGPGDATAVDGLISDPGGPGLPQPSGIQPTAFDTASTISFAAGDDDFKQTSLGFNFPFFGKTITHISVNTNGLIELLETGEDCTECGDLQTHLDGDHIEFALDTIFIANTDLITGMWIDKYPDHIVIYWAGKMFSNVDIYEFDEIAMRLEMFDDGRILWKFYDMDYDANPGDLFTGLYDADSQTEIATPVQPTAFNDQNVELAFEFDPETQLISAIPWNSNDEHIAADDNSSATYTLPFNLPFFDRTMVEIEVSTEGSIELLELNDSSRNDGDYVRDFDAILSVFDDLITTVFIDIEDDKVRITWIGFVDAGSDTFVSNEISTRVTLFNDRRIRWDIGDAEYASQDYDLFTGLVDADDGIEYEVPGGAAGFNAENVNVSFLWASSNDRNLEQLSVSGGSLSPAFSPRIFNYEVNVPADISDITVTATTSSPVATIEVNGQPAVSGEASGPVTLSGEETPIILQVTAEDGTAGIYRVVVTQAAVISDADSDGIEDSLDNCPGTANSDQADLDGDAQGDVCDADDDNDRIPDIRDLFPRIPLGGRADFDGDGAPDQCDAACLSSGMTADTDDDGDGVPDETDQCITTDLTLTGDLDGDGCDDADEDTDDDGDGLPDDFETANGLDPLDAGDALLDTDRDGLSNLDEFLTGTDPLIDDVAPVLSIPADLTVVSTGQLTSVSLGSASAFDARDGDIVPVASPAGPYPPGRHSIVWRAEDAAGNAAEDIQILEVIPLVNFPPDQETAEGNSVEILLTLNGPAPDYPVEITYSVTGSAENPADHDATDGTVRIDSGTEASIRVTIADDDAFEGTETIVFTLGETLGATAGTRSTHTIRITETNVAPRVSIRVEQQGIPVSTVFSDEGPFRIIASVQDPNPDDEHSYLWTSTNPAMQDSGEATDEIFLVDPSNLPEGVYEFLLQVTDNGNPPATTTVPGLVRVLETRPELNPDTDSDDDGISDAEEGFGDSDGDRIPDYLDNSDSPNLLPVDTGTASLETNTGLRLRLGDDAFSSGSSSPRIDESDVQTPDVEFGYPNGVFDFDILDVPESGIAQIVYPLVHPVPENAGYRKFVDDQWQAFITDDRNRLSTSPGNTESCPEPGSDSWNEGLNAGDLCLQLTLSDGGPNDADGEVNGIIDDPGGIAVSINVGFESLETPDRQETSTASNVVVLTFRLSSSSGDVEFSGLQLSASGTGVDTDISRVRVYVDTDGNGKVDPDESPIGSGTYSADDGTLDLVFDQPYLVPAGDTDFLVTYSFGETGDNDE